VRKKNVLATLAQSLAATALVSVLWMLVGYSLAFKTNPNPTLNQFIGDLSYLFLQPLKVDSLTGTIPESVFMLFQMTFAIITPALIAGAFADRMKFSAFLWFTGLWLIFVYCPIAHMVWGGGILFSLGALDYAGGSVVHLNAGTAALVTCLVMGKRIGYGRENMSPHNLVLSVVGVALLWVGWFGFNAGSALSAGFNAGMAAVLDAGGMGHFQEAVGAGHDFRRGVGPRGDYPGIGLCRSGRRADHRRHRRRGLLRRRRLDEARAGL
jgi:Amt family ammonium transporter